MTSTTAFGAPGRSAPARPTVGEAAADITPRQLSCYTANLAEYLAGEYRDPLGRIARSVRLAVRSEGRLVAFSHHCVPLNALPDGHHLAYAGAPTAATAIECLTAELRAHGRTLVVAQTVNMPWSAVTTGLGAPHFLLVDDRRGPAWHVTDSFSAMLPAGRQQPFSGWLQNDQLLGCMQPRATLSPVHRLRNQHAFGLPVPLPLDGTYQWLIRASGPTQPLAHGQWITEPAAALDFLTEACLAMMTGPGDPVLLDDIWACAQHHTFRYTHLLAADHLADDLRSQAAEARQIWHDLPMTLRFAAESALRGRPRPSLITAAFAVLKRVEASVGDQLARAGYAMSITAGQHSETTEMKVTP